MPILAALIALQAAVPPVSAPAPVVPARPLAPLLGPGPSRKAIVLAAVRAEWPSYDAGAKGRLTPLEFSTWVLRAHGMRIAPAGSKGPGVPAARAMNATASAFALADADHDGGVTPDEMASFLTR
ncbi:MAG TPA: hypothetical protein VGC10_08510 [Sphingomonas sp.]